MGITRENFLKIDGKTVEIDEMSAFSWKKNTGKLEWRHEKGKQKSCIFWKGEFDSDVIEKETPRELLKLWKEINKKICSDYETKI